MSLIFVTGDFDLPEVFASETVKHLKEPCNPQEIQSYLFDINHYIVGGPEYVNEDIMRAAPSLKQIVVMGTGTNSFVDLKAAFKRGIHVDNTPSINAEAVAEYALGSIIFNSANSFLSRRILLDGGWYQKPHATLSEMSYGIIGLGDIGSKIARKLRALTPEAQISYYARTRKLDLEQELGLHYEDPLSMVRNKSHMILSVTYNKESHQLVNSRLLNEANSNLSIFNFSNPNVIEPIALKDALAKGLIKFAYFDGYYNEWIENKGVSEDQFGLLNLGEDKFIATSHIAAQTHSVIKEILHVAHEKISSFRKKSNFICEVKCV